MRKLLLLSAVLAFGLAACTNPPRTTTTAATYSDAIVSCAPTAVTVCNAANANVADGEGILVGGVRWAATNIETPGVFAAKPGSYGGLFTWQEAENACPEGWRLPTRDELLSLAIAAVAGWVVTEDGINGRAFGTEPHQLFLPAAGFRTAAGVHRNAGIRGYYWAEGTDAVLAWFFHINRDNVTANLNDRALGFSVRCVAR